MLLSYRALGRDSALSDTMTSLRSNGLNEKTLHPPAHSDGMGRKELPSGTVRPQSVFTSARISLVGEGRANRTSFMSPDSCKIVPNEGQLTPDCPTFKQYFSSTVKFAGR